MTSTDYVTAVRGRRLAVDGRSAEFPLPVTVGVGRTRGVAGTDVGGQGWGNGPLP